MATRPQAAGAPGLLTGRGYPQLTNRSCRATTVLVMLSLPQRKRSSHSLKELSEPRFRGDDPTVLAYAAISGSRPVSRHHTFPRTVRRCSALFRRHSPRCGSAVPWFRNTPRPAVLLFRRPAVPWFRRLVVPQPCSARAKRHLASTRRVFRPFECSDRAQQDRLVH